MNSSKIPVVKAMVQQLHCKLCSERFNGPNRLICALVHLKYHHEKIFDLNQKKSQSVSDLRSEVVTSSSTEPSASCSKASQTDDGPLNSADATVPSRQQKVFSPVPGNLQNYFTLLEFTSDKPYKCLKCHRQFVNLKMCVVHLSNIHSVSLKQNTSRTEKRAESANNGVELQVGTRKQTARKSIRTRQERAATAQTLLQKRETTRAIRKRLARQLERRRLSSIKVALIRQKFAMKAVSRSRVRSDNFQFYSACSSPESDSARPAFEKSLPFRQSQSLSESREADSQSLPSKLESNEITDQSQFSSLVSREPSFQSNTTSSSDGICSSSDLMINCDGFDQSPTAIESRDYSNQLAASTSEALELENTFAVENPPFDEVSTSDPPVEAVGSVWSTMEFNSTKVLAKSNDASPSEVPLKKRKYSVDSGRPPHSAIFIPSPSQSTAMLKKLKLQSPAQQRPEDSPPPHHRILQYSKSVPHGVSMQPDQPKLKQTARKSTRPYGGRPFPILNPSKN